MLSPLALLWLLPVGGLITLLYLLKQKRQEKRVPSLLLWDQVLQETTAASPFQKLRFDPLLLLQLLAVLLLCLALARPFLWGEALGGKTVVLVLDGSASMKATDVAGGRFAEAVRQARDLVARKAPTDTVAIVLAGTHPVTLAPLTTEKPKLFAALEQAATSDTTAGPREALLLAASLVASRRDAGITFLTDGAFARQDELSLGNTELRTVIVGKRGANVGITAFDVRETEGENGGGWEAFVAVEKADSAPRTVPVEIRAGDTLIEAREFALKPGESRSLVVPLAPKSLPPDADLLTAHLESADDLAADNEAYAALPTRTQVRALLVSSGDDPFLERALTLAPRVQLSRQTAALFTAQDARANDVVIWDDALPPSGALPPGRYLFWKTIPTGPLAPVRAAGNTAPLTAPVVLDFDRASPLLRFADLSGVRIREARRIALAPWATVVAEGKDGPLIAAGERGGSRIAYVAFRPPQSDLPLRVAFPVFVANAISYLSSKSDSEVARVFRPGEAIPLPSGANTVRVPGGKPTAASGAAFTDTDRVGIYSVATGSNPPERFGVALLSSAETVTTPEPNPSLIVSTPTGPKEAGDATQPARHRSPQEWWPYLAVPLLLLLVAEWFVYHRTRRTV